MTDTEDATDATSRSPHIIERLKRKTRWKYEIKSKILIRDSK